MEINYKGIILSSDYNKEDEAMCFVEDGLKYSCDGLRLLKATDNCSDKVIIRGGVLVICDNAFLESKSSEVIIPDSLIIIGDRAFKGSKINKIDIPSNVQAIGNEVFSNCIELSKKTFLGKDIFVRITEDLNINKIKRVEVDNIFINDDGYYLDNEISGRFNNDTLCNIELDNIGCDNKLRSNILLEKLTDGKLKNIYGSYNSIKPILISLGFNEKVPLEWDPTYMTFSCLFEKLRGDYVYTIMINGFEQETGLSLFKRLVNHDYPSLNEVKTLTCAISSIGIEYCGL